MMYTRRKVLFHLVRELGNPSNVVIQKSMFLLANSIQTKDKLYDFFPDRRGCYSLRLRSDYHYLADSGYLEEDYENKTYRANELDEYTCRITFFIDKEIASEIKRIAAFVGGHTEKELIEQTYRSDPFYAIRSDIVDSLDLDENFHESLEEEKSHVANSEKALYTIGYEGRSIDGFLNELIKRNIRTLFDVRKNAYSMQTEFSAQPLRKALDEAGIAYVHCPEVGIATDKRQELLPNGRQSELFEWYKENILPRSRGFVDKAFSRFENGSIAFMCYEKDPLDCHRSRLSDYCLNEESRFVKVIHI